MSHQSISVVNSLFRTILLKRNQQVTVFQQQKSISLLMWIRAKCDCRIPVSHIRVKHRQCFRHASNLYVSKLDCLLSCKSTNQLIHTALYNYRLHQCVTLVLRVDKVHEPFVDNIYNLTSCGAQMCSSVHHFSNMANNGDSKSPSTTLEQG